jgi:hypothetical protein
VSAAGKTLGAFTLSVFLNFKFVTNFKKNTEDASIWNPSHVLRNTHYKYLCIFRADFQSAIINISGSLNAVFRVLSCKQRQLTIGLCNCYVYIVTFLLVLRPYLTENTVSVTNTNHGVITSINICRSSCEVSVILPDINQNGELSTNCRKNPNIKVNEDSFNVPCGQTESHNGARSDLVQVLAKEP